MKKILMVLICLVTISQANSDNISINKFAGKVSNHNNINIYVDEDIQDKKISLFVPDKISNEDLFNMFKNTMSKLKFNLRKNGKTYYLSKKITYSTKSYIYKLKYDTSKDCERVLSSLSVIHTYLSGLNAFMIKSTKNKYLKIKAFLDKTDIKSKQVILKVTILEIDEDSVRERGIQYGSIYRGIDGTIQTALNAIIAPVSTNNPLVGSSNFYAALRILNSDSNVKIKQNPFILAKNDKTFVFQAVDNIPYLVSTTTTEATNTSEQNSIEYKDVGLKLSGKAFIHDDYITLDIDLTSEDLLTSLSADNTMPMTYKRVLKSNSNIKFNQVLLLSGLKRVKNDDTTYSFPYLSDIPYLSVFFKYTSHSIKHTSITIAIEAVNGEEFTKNMLSYVSDNIIEEEISSNDNFSKETHIIIEE